MIVKLSPVLVFKATLHLPVRGPALKTAAQDSRGPKLERPTITIGIIARRIEISSLIARGDEHEIAKSSASAQLFQCACRELGDSLLKSDANIVTLPSADLLTAMQRLAVSRLPPAFADPN